MSDTALRGLFVAFTEGGEPTQPQLNALRGLARSVLPADEDPDDAVSGLLETIIRATRVGGSASAHKLLDLHDGDLHEVVRYRLRQHAIRQRPRWSLTKSLRAHVAEALNCLPSPLVAPPPSLLHGDRLSTELVAEATAFFLAEERDLERTPTAIAKRLLEIYLVPQAPEIERSGFDDEVRRRRDAIVLAADIREVLGPQLLRVLRLRHQGIGFEQIADQENIAVSTAHGRYRVAVERLQAFVQRTRTVVDPVFRTTPSFGKRDSSVMEGAAHGEEEPEEVRSGVQGARRPGGREGAGEPRADWASARGAPRAGRAVEEEAAGARG